MLAETFADLCRKLFPEGINPSQYEILEFLATRLFSEQAQHPARPQPSQVSEPAPQPWTVHSAPTPSEEAPPPPAGPIRRYRAYSEGRTRAPKKTPVGPLEEAVAHVLATKEATAAEIESALESKPGVDRAKILLALSALGAVPEQLPDGKVRYRMPNAGAAKAS